MPPLQSILVFMLAGLALNITPGPDMLYVAARSTGEGRASGVVSALGIGAGTLVHITLVAVGFAALLQTVPAAYNAVRIAGGIYLVWLGVRALRKKSDALVVERPPRAPIGTVFRQGVITNVLNPKVALFFVAFLPQFVDPSRGGAHRAARTRPRAARANHRRGVHRHRPAVGDGEPALMRGHHHPDSVVSARALSS